VLLPEELVHARFHDQTRAGRIDIQPVGIARRTAVDAHPEAPRQCLVRPRHDQVQVACVEAGDDVGTGPGGPRRLTTSRLNY
jgi:hypothetical protein